MSHPPSNKPGHTWSDWFANLPTIALLILILVISTGEMVHGQLLKLGESMFRDPAQGVQYFMLRADPEQPSCNPNLNVDVELARQLSAPAPSQSDDIDALFTQRQQDPQELRESITKMVATCQARHALYDSISSHITPQVKFYRAMETSFFGLFHFGADNRALILLILLICTATHTTLGFHHICLRPPRFKRDYVAQAASMAVANGMLLFSTISYFEIARHSGVPMEDSRLPFAWMALFAVLLLASCYRLLRQPQPAMPGDGSWVRALECVPLVAWMPIMTSVYFFAQGHPSGPAIYANKIIDILSVPLALALHIWAGMLFKQTRVVDLFMNILRPWKLSPEALTYLILLAAGLPTAYAGMSSVFVIAAGAIIYHEVRAVGGTRQYALAATAMSGSLGVVLRPSLLVVGIAALNREVTTTQLFYWGVYVFALTSTLFFIASQLHRRQRHQAAAVASPRVAVPAMLREIKYVLPYVAVVMAIALFFSEVLDTPFDEISAPHILPIMMLLVLVFDKKLENNRAWSGSGATSVAAASAFEPPAAPNYAASRQSKVSSAIHTATSETVEHVGAWITLVIMTFLMGGMIERSEIMSFAPSEFANVWVAMAFLVVAKVLLGMVMEPIGAVVLVSSTLAPIAYQNGIAPVHFWMMVLVAFELGYLTPPVALNQLVTRQVVGEAEIDRADQEVAGLSFYRRYERWILPCAVMSLSLAIVAFGPLAVQRFEILRPILNLWN